MKTIKIAVADDHPIFRKGLVDILNNAEYFNIEFEGNNGLELLNYVKSNAIDICLIDVEMPVMNGVETVKKIIDENIQTKICILTGHHDNFLVKELMSLGIDGFVLKQTSADEIVLAIETIMDGKNYIAKDIKIKTEELNKTKADIEHKLVDLSKKELDILKLIMRNKSSKEIADMLFISAKTVENHRSNICVKLDLRGPNALFRFAMEARYYLL
jgi:DNA-binding NarL/FixJ family response regulator